jgi:hypothetical protein
MEVVYAPTSEETASAIGFLRLTTLTVLPYTIFKELATFTVTGQ